jgi:hypothetical protein
LYPARIVTEAELGGGDGELGLVVGKPDVRAQGDAKAAAEAEPVDHGDGRLGAAGERRERGVAERIVSRRLFAGSGGVEFGNVGPGREGPLARAPQDNHADRVVPLRLSDAGGQGLPHDRREGVHACRVVGNNEGDVAIALEPHGSRRGLTFGHAKS